MNQICPQINKFQKNVYYFTIDSSKLEDASENDTSHFFPTKNETKLSENERHSCEGPLTTQECLIALKSMKSGKSPGSDGFPAEFYKVFWPDISPFLMNAIECAYEKRILSTTQRSGILSLIPKENKLPHSLKNWRRLNLLNCDYEIFAKAIANRILKVLTKIISSDQNVFLRGRSMGENIRLTEEIINYTEKENKPGLLLYVDFEKAFDTLEWTFIEKCLKHLNFGPTLIKWIKHFYREIRSSIQINGRVSESFSLSRGVRQGCIPAVPIFVCLIFRNIGQLR